MDVSFEFLCLDYSNLIHNRQNNAHNDKLFLHKITCPVHTTYQAQLKSNQPIPAT